MSRESDSLMSSMIDEVSACCSRRSTPVRCCCAVRPTRPAGYSAGCPPSSHRTCSPGTPCRWSASHRWSGSPASWPEGEPTRCWTPRCGKPSATATGMPSTTPGAVHGAPAPGGRPGRRHAAPQPLFGDHHRHSVRTRWAKPPAGRLASARPTRRLPGPGVDPGARRRVVGQRQARPGLSADEPDGRTRLDLRVDQLQQEPAQRVARTHHRRQARHRLGALQHRRIRWGPGLHRHHRRLGRRSPGVTGGADRRGRTAAARIRRRRHHGPGRRTALRRLRPHQRRQHARPDDAAARARGHASPLRRQPAAVPGRVADVPGAPRCTAVLRPARRERRRRAVDAGAVILHRPGEAGATAVSHAAIPTRTTRSTPSPPCGAR